MKLADEAELLAPRNPPKPVAPPHPFDTAPVFPARLVVLSGIKEPETREEIDAIINAAAAAEAKPDQWIGVQVDPTADARAIIGSDTGDGTGRFLYAHRGAFIHAPENAQVRRVIVDARWPVGARHYLGMVLARLVTKDPVNRWSSWAAIRCVVSERGASLVAWADTTSPSLPQNVTGPTGLAAVVLLDSDQFGNHSRCSATVVCSPWSTTRVRQPAARGRATRR